ncbi:MAG: hypothetical protein ACRCXM_10195 [Beijerinckiaceae bacterium]
MTDHAHRDGAGKEASLTQSKAPWDRKDPHPEKSVTPDPEQRAASKALDVALKETFPASDPPAVTQPLKRPGKPKRRRT